MKYLNSSPVPGILSGILLVMLSCFFSECIDDEPIKIQSVSPLIGCSGGTLSIMGWGFSGTANENIVTINGIPVDVIKSYTNMLVVALPDTVMSGRIRIKAGNNAVTWPDYSITHPRYFIKFKLDGVQKYYDECEPNYLANSTCGVGGVSFVKVGNIDTPQAAMSICDDNVVKLSGSVMESWAGEQFAFSAADVQASLIFYDNEMSYASYNAHSQQGSELTVTDISPDLSAIHKDVYIASGTFKCNVATQDGNYIPVTEGEFSVRFTVAN